MDRITVIIPVYNIAIYISRCLDSVLKQTYQELEIIAVNDGSTDGSLEILNSYALLDKRVVVIDKENGGVTSCRKTGVERANGEYVFFLDGDDWLELDTLERLYKVAKERDADVVVGDIYKSFGDRDVPYKADSFFSLGSKEYIYQLAIGKQYWCLCMKLLKTDIVKRMNIPDGLSMAEDMTGMLQLAYFAGTIAKCDYYGYHYYQRQGASTKTPTKKHAIDALQAAEYVTNFLKEQGAYEEYFDEIAWINLRCLLTSCNQGGVSRNTPQVVQIYEKYYKSKYLSVFHLLHRLVLLGFKYGFNGYKLLFVYKRIRRAI